MAGGGGAKKLIINFVLDNPAKTYVGGGIFLYFLRQYQTRTTYNLHFGKFDFQRRLERG
jgi:hypothetical protein